MRIKSTSKCTQALLVFLLAATLWVEAYGKTIVRRVRFERGRTTAILRDRIGPNTYVVYVLRASEGQAMAVRIPGENGVNIQSIEAPGGAVLLDDPGQEWSGRLPRTGDYRIRVAMSVESYSARRYTMEVIIR